jgi:hypothetical protein
VTLAESIHYHCAVLWAGRRKKREGDKGGENEEE